MRLPVLLLAACVVLAGALAANAFEQTITPLTPDVEQRIEVLGGAGDVQTVEAIDPAEVQGVIDHTPPTASGRAAKTAAKIATGVASVAISCGFMVASLLFF